MPSRFAESKEALQKATKESQSGASAASRRVYFVPEKETTGCQCVVKFDGCQTICGCCRSIHSSKEQKAQVGFGGLFWTRVVLCTSSLQIVALSPPCFYPEKLFIRLFDTEKCATCQNTKLLWQAKEQARRVSVSSKNCRNPVIYIKDDHRHDICSCCVCFGPSLAGTDGCPSLGQCW